MCCCYDCVSFVPFLGTEFSDGEEGEGLLLVLLEDLLPPPLDLPLPQAAAETATASVASTTTSVAATVARREKKGISCMIRNLLLKKCRPQ